MTPAEGQIESATKQSILRKLAAKLSPAMETKKFCIVFEFDERTHWLFGPDDEANALQRVAENVANFHTKGAQPKVTVLILSASGE